MSTSGGLNEENDVVLQWGDLSMGGRVTLINLVLTSMPFYFLSFYKIPKKVARDITNIQMEFLVGR